MHNLKYDEAHHLLYRSRSLISRLSGSTMGSSSDSVCYALTVCLRRAQGWDLETIATPSAAFPPWSTMATSSSLPGAEAASAAFQSAALCSTSLR